MINVLGDALAAGIMAHVCRKDFAQDTGPEVSTPSLSGQAAQRPKGEPRSGGQGSTSATHQLGRLPPIPPHLDLLTGTQVTGSSRS